MAAISVSWTEFAGSAMDPDSPVDTTLITGLFNNGKYVREWVGQSYYAGATGNHDHDGVNSKSVVLADGVVTEAKLATGAVTNAKLGASAVTWGKISTSLQQATGNIYTGDELDISFTGGTQTLGWGVASTTPTGGPYVALDLRTYYANAYTAGFRFFNNTASTAGYFIQAAYINSSPPWNMGDGDIPLFVFLEITPTGDVIRVDIADAPPWGYNGPTSVRPIRESADGRKFRAVREIIAEFGTLAAARAAGLTRAQILDRLATDVLVEEEITHAIKNRDMPLIPHPFVTKQDPANTIVLLDPVSPLMRRLAVLHNEQALDERLTDLLMAGQFNIGNTPLARVSPAGVMVVSASLK